MEKLTIKESLELLAAIELGAVAGIEIAKGGIGMDDLPKAIELLKKSDVLIEGVKGIKGIPAEVKDIDQAELLQLGTAAYGLIKNIIEATKKEEVK